MKILLVIDIQQRYMAHYDPDLLSRVNARIREAQAAGTSVFYTRNIPRLESTENYDYAAELLIVSEHLYDKRSPSAFSNHAFCADLKKSDVTEIEMIGVDGNCCVKRTCLDAVSAGFEVTLNLSCIAARNEKIYIKTLAELAEKNVTLLQGD